MKTCKIISCWRKQGCHLERDGIADLCPEIKGIIEEAKKRTEIAWRKQNQTHQVVPLPRFEGTAKVVLDSFTVADGLGRVAAERQRRADAVFNKYVLLRKYQQVAVDPGPLPQPWLPLSENNNFFDTPTHIEDRSAVGISRNPDQLVAELQRAPRIYTKRDKEYWRELNARVRQNEIQDIRDEKIERIMNEMEV